MASAANASIKILIVEDELAIQKALSNRFTREGFQVIKAENGEDGLSLALKEHPNVILLDIIMPKLDGISMVSELRKDAWGSTVPVIILTNLNIDDARIKDVTEFKPAFYLTKAEWKLKDVVKKVQELVSNERLSAK